MTGCRRAGDQSSSSHEIEFTLGAVAPPSAQPAVVAVALSRRRCHGQLSRESEIFVIVRVYLFAREFNVANQASTTCRLCLESTVETSTPPLLYGRREHTRLAGPKQEEFCTPATRGVNIEHPGFVRSVAEGEDRPGRHSTS